MQELQNPDIYESVVPTSVVDTSGTRCPIPLLKAKQALKVLAVGESLKLISTDPSSVGDFDAMLKHLPHSLLATKVDVIDSGKKSYIFLIQKGWVGAW